jgi:hypothetical protein
VTTAIGAARAEQSRDDFIKKAPKSKSAARAKS